MSRKIWSLIVLVIAFSLLLTFVAEAAGVIQTLSITLVDTIDFPLTRVYFSINDMDGAPVTILREAYLQLYENDVLISSFQVTTVENPLLIGVIIDSAGSFRIWEGGATRLDHAKEVSRWLISPQYGRLLPDDEVAVFAFQSGDATRLVNFTYDHQRVLDQGIASVSTDGNNFTALFDVLQQAINETSIYAGARRRVLIVFSDGVDRTSSFDIERVITQAREAHLLIYTVGMGPNLAPDQPGSAFLRRLANETGGRYIWYRSGRQGADDAIQEFLDDLVAQRSGYRLSYVSNQYRGTAQIRLVVQQRGTQAEDRAMFEVPPLPPVVTVDAIRPGQILEGIVTVRPSIARAQRELDRVEYRIDDELVFTSRSSPWTFEWDTQEYASSITDYDEHTLSVVVCDLAQQCSEPYSLLVGTRLPTPTPTPIPPPSTVIESDDRINLAVSLLALAIALAALVLIIIYMRRGGGQAVGRAVQEVRRKTRVWMNQTKIFGDGGEVSPVPTLTVVSETQQGKKLPLTGRVIFVGRDPERADLVFEWDDYISRRHIKIAQEGEQWYVWDMNSANRTWLNQTIVRASLSEGLDLQEAMPLHDGDILKLGPELALRFDLPMNSKSPSELNGQDGSNTVADAPTRSFFKSDSLEPDPGMHRSDVENVDTVILRR